MSAERLVYLHVGAPKTGTTYLQDRLALNASTLADHGVVFPTGNLLSDPTLFQFRAALDLLGRTWAGPGAKAAGKWDALARKVRSVKGGRSVVISHEILAPATRDQIARARVDLGVAAGSTELHVVYSARDIARQVPAGWQEAVKQGQSMSYRAFCNRATQGDLWFAHAFDIPTVLGAWTAGLPAEQVHIVTVPQRGATAPEELWLRYCRAFGIDPSWAPRDSDKRNPSLGMAETQLLRRLNRRMARHSAVSGAHDYLIRELIAERELAGRPSEPVLLPVEMRDWARAEAQRWIDWLDQSGVHVVGDPEELRPVFTDQPWHNPDRPGARPMLNAALDALVVMTREAASRPDPRLSLSSRLRARTRALRDQ